MKSSLSQTIELYQRRISKAEKDSEFYKGEGAFHEASQENLVGVILCDVVARLSKILRDNDSLP